MRLVLKLIGATGMVVVVVVGVVALLVFTGDPKPCADREVSISSQANRDLKIRWDEFEERAASAPASVTLTEGEVRSRFVEYVFWNDNIDLENVQVYLCPDGYGEATATFVGGGPRLDLLARGTLDFSGDKPKIDIDKIKVGNLPGFVPLGALVNYLSDEAKTIDVDVNLTSITFSDGEVTLQGAP